MSSTNTHICEFFSRLEEALRSQGLQKKEFAAKIGIAPQQLTRYKNQQMPSVEILVRMAIVLNVSTDYLLGLNKSVNPWQARAEQAERKLAVLRDCSQTLAETVQKMTSVF